VKQGKKEGSGREGRVKRVRGMEKELKNKR
jgi:hypothetical protein